MIIKYVTTIILKYSTIPCFPYSSGKWTFTLLRETFSTWQDTFFCGIGKVNYHWYCWWKFGIHRKTASVHCSGKSTLFEAGLRVELKCESNSSQVGWLANRALKWNDASQFIFPLLAGVGVSRAQRGGGRFIALEGVQHSPRPVPDCPLGLGPLQCLSPLLTALLKASKDVWGCGFTPTCETRQKEAWKANIGSWGPSTS